jgi:hypothetical protein
MQVARVSRRWTAKLQPANESSPAVYRSPAGMNTSHPNTPWVSTRSRASSERRPSDLQSPWQKKCRSRRPPCLGRTQVGASTGQVQISHSILTSFEERKNFYNEKTRLAAGFLLLFGIYATKTLPPRELIAIIIAAITCCIYSSYQAWPYCQHRYSLDEIKRDR